MKSIRTLTYCPELNPITGSVTASLVMCQLEYWFEKKKGNSFYKFLSPCDHDRYQEGDSWTEELGFSKAEFRSAFARIGKVYNSKTAYTQSTNPFDGKLYLSYHDRIRKITVYMRNDALVLTTLNTLATATSSATAAALSTAFTTPISSAASALPTATALSTVFTTPISSTASTLSYVNQESEGGFNKDYKQTLQHNRLTTDDESIPYGQILDTFHQTCPSLPQVTALTKSHHKLIKKLWQHVKGNVQLIKQAFASVESSHFLCGRIGKGTWKASFEWIMKLDKFSAILDGKYGSFEHLGNDSAHDMNGVDGENDANRVKKPRGSSVFHAMYAHDYDLEALERLEMAHLGF